MFQEPLEVKDEWKQLLNNIAGIKYYGG